MTAQLDPLIDAEQRYAEDAEFRVIVVMLGTLMIKYPLLGSVDDLRQALLIIDREQREMKRREEARRGNP